mgnify:CR=1 FL=1
MNGLEHNNEGDVNNEPIPSPEIISIHSDYDYNSTDSAGERRLNGGSLPTGFTASLPQPDNTALFTINGVVPDVPSVITS